MAVGELEARVDDLLSSSHLRTHLPARYLGNGAEPVRVPRAVPERRWVAPSVADAIDRVNGVLAEAEPWSGGSADALRAALATAHRTIAFDAPSLAVVTELAAGSPVPVVAIAPAPSLAGHFEAVSGIETVSDPATLGYGSARVLVVYGAKAFPPKTLADVLAAHGRNGHAVLFVERGALERPRSNLPFEASTRPMTGVPGGAGASTGARYDVVVAEIGRIVDRRRREGFAPVIVAADPLPGLEGVDAPVVSPARAAEAGRRTPAALAIVVGDERVLGASGRRAFGERREHVVVAPVDVARRVGLEARLTAPAIDRRRDRTRERGLGR